MITVFWDIDGVILVDVMARGETILAVRTWLREQERSWYREAIHALASRWRKAVDLDGDYVEK